ncbi:hypothetical protein BDV96DRAFT_611817 [Lophiotrema nucula]|uniref:Glutamyl-tRNA amidotransferase complex subunit Gta3 domain-containing protein n=1 Tax=Lophiotrema nucula TaxID=690887 RepID=A0A6A5ZAJ0_9PLEO|nr:hypothetical protein BDV96DRAFT_611817 [Lophiotrema nucula]
MWSFQTLASSIIAHPSHPTIRRTPSGSKPPSQAKREACAKINLDELFKEPTWSIESLLPPKELPRNAHRVSSRQLHHLLRLSALPIPTDAREERKMIDTLSAQLHFVGEIQQVDTTGVKPLRALRDETEGAEKEQTITLETLKDALANEEVIGKHYQRIRRKVEKVDAKDAEDWDVLGSAERKSGQFFVVDSQRPLK